MLESLVDALWLTVIGMAMTFGALGALVLGMYAMTALIRDRQADETEPAGSAAPDPEPSAVVEDQGRYIAAAAAVAAALAQAETRPALGNRASAGATTEVDPWTPYVRNRHIAQRDRFMQRPFGGR